MTEPECTCTALTVRHEGIIASIGYTKYAYYLDEWVDDSEFDPACPYHGENGTMVVLVSSQT